MFKDKIQMQIMEEIKNNYIEDELSFKEYKQTQEYKNLFQEKYNIILDSYFNAIENKNLLIKLETHPFLSEDEMLEEIKKQIFSILSSNKLYVRHGYNFIKLNEDSFPILDKNFEKSQNILADIGTQTKKKSKIISLKELFIDTNKFILNFYYNLYITSPTQVLITENKEPYFLKEYIEQKIFLNYKNLKTRLKTYISKEEFLKEIFNNKKYIYLKLNYINKEMILKEIPSDFTQLFPITRLLKRHFILHIGDTNTGKTYDAIQDLKSAKSGVYLAPLRLLALEIQEKLLNDGVLCSMTTGEEENIIENATHMSSTIEKLKLNEYYDICVIDEAQMIEDENRGWAWTNAILGVYADKIHICMSENAKDIVIKLIKLCNDTYEIVEHKRNTELQFENSNFSFDTIQDNDALIVFSRRKVLQVASELEDMGIKASVIYGALPYSVRKNEIEKFIKGETKVVVSTDAIGMGMNLPIKRIVFLESSKYDGRENRLLTLPEIKQIAGRAGRQGIFDVGYVTSVIDSKYIEKMLNKNYKPIKEARIQLPKTLVNIDLPLSNIMENWRDIPDSGCFKKSQVSNDLKLCQILENLNLNLTKETMLNLINIPFDEKSQDLQDLWLELIVCHYNNEDITYLDIPFYNKDDDLDTLELNYKKLDLYFSFAKVVGYNKDNFIDKIMEIKEELSFGIMEKLKEKKNHRQCRICKKILKWDYPYSICNHCYHQLYN